MGNVMLHKTQITNGRATMLHLQQLVIKAKQRLVFKPMSYHLMLANPNKKDSPKVTSLNLVFYFRYAGAIKLTVPIKKPWNT